jgi:hypothetical protein
MAVPGGAGRSLDIPVFYYSIARELLWGNIGGESFACAAKSGGGRGGLTPQQSLSSYNPHRKMQAATRGGAIPPGWWTIGTPVVSGDTKGPWVSVLTPDEATRQAYAARDYDKARFKIHGPGPKGSDGCIVIERPHRVLLLTAVRASPTGARLRVLWEGERMNERLEHSSRLA